MKTNRVFLLFIIIGALGASTWFIASNDFIGKVFNDDRDKPPTGVEIDREPAHISMTGLVPGPDAIVGNLFGLAQFGSSGTQVGLAMGTEVCNAGTVDIDWFALPNNAHPVVPQNLYRLSGGASNDNRFEQIGQSNVQHAFFALAQNSCGFGCNGGNGTHLGSGCSNTDSPAFNAGPNLGSRAWINPFTGFFPGSNPNPNDHSGHSHTGSSHRILVETVDLNTTLNQGAAYYAEAGYIVPHESNWCQSHAGECNMYNNVSYRRFGVVGTSTFNFSPIGSTVQTQPAIYAWPGATHVQIEPDPGNDGIGVVGYKVTNPSPGVWHYEYAVYNENIDRAIQSLSIPVGANVTLSNMGFHAPPQHPGWTFDGTVGNAGYSSAPWTQTQTGGSMSWSSETFAQNQNANAVRWGTMYNFRFDADKPPENVNATIGFFKTGSPISVSVQGPGDGSTATPTNTATPTSTPCGAWQSGPPQDPARYAIQGVIGTDNKFYMAGGQNGNPDTVYNQLSRFDPVTNTWNNLAPLPVAVGQATMGAWNGKIYVAGGLIGSSVTNALQIYDIATNTWTSGANMPGGREAAAGAVVNGKFYVMGGDDLNNAVNTTYIYDIATNAWSTGAVLPGARTNTYGTALGGSIYVYGGVRVVGTTFTTDTLLRYDPVANTWTNLGSAGTSGARGNFGAVSPLGLGTGYLLITDGADVNGASTTATHIYDISSGTFSAGPPMITARAGHAQDMLPDGRVLVADGFDTPGTTTSAVETLFNSCAATTPTPPPPTPTFTATFTPTRTATNTPTTTPTEPPPPPGFVQFSSPTFFEDESQVAAITLTRTGNISSTNTVWFSTTHGTAFGGADCNNFFGPDYLNVTVQQVTFNPNETSKTVNVTLCGDGLPGELDETVNLSLAGANVGPPATLTINDTATMFQNQANIAINQGAAADPYPSTITVEYVQYILGSMRVTIYDYSTAVPANVSFLLVGPGGQKFILMANAGGFSASGPATLTFSDTAGQIVPFNGPLATGDLEPTSYGIVANFPAPAPSGPYNLPGSTIGGFGSQLMGGSAASTFGGTNTNGTWKLYVREQAPPPFAPSTVVGNIAGGWGIEFLGTTAARASISGRVMTASGNGIRNAKVVISSNSLPQPIVTTTGSFGYFTFDGLATYETYVVTVNSQRYTFSTPSRVITLVDNVTDADFVADPVE